MVVGLWRVRDALTKNKTGHNYLSCVKGGGKSEQSVKLVSLCFSEG